MAYSRTRFILDAGSIATPTFSYAAFPTLGAGADPENVQFDVYWMETLLVLNTDYSVNTTNNTITLLSTITGDLVADEVISIKRDTKKDDRYVDWTNNAGITEADLDLDSDQLFYLAQEAWDEALTALRKAPSETKWDGEGLPSYNCSPALVGSGWVTLDQVHNLINGGDTATLGDVNEWCFDGDGTTEDFVLNGASANTTEENLWISFNGILLCPCSDGTAFSTEQNAAVVALNSVATYDQVGTPATFWDDDLDVLIAAVVAVLADWPGFTALYSVYRDHINGSPVTPILFVGTAAECIAEIATWDPGDTFSGRVRWHSLRGTRWPYTWDQATRTVSFDDPPEPGTDICVRQLTGTVAVDLADVSLDGSELQDDSVLLNHLDFASGTAYRVLKVDAAGDPSVGTITSAYVSDFTAAVNSLQWRSMIAPTGSVNLNTQKITSLQAGSDAGDGVNFGQLTVTNARVSDLETQVDGGSAGHNSASGTPVIGVQPDLYYNNASNSRNAFDGATVTTACNTQSAALDSQVLMTGFIPRWIKFLISGDIKDSGGSIVDNNVNYEFEFVNWDTENGFDPVFATEGNCKVYKLPRPRNLDTNHGDFDYGSLGYDDFFLVIEQVSPWRTWLRIKSGGLFCSIVRYNDPNQPGSLQVLAAKGL